MPTADAIERYCAARYSYDSISASRQRQQPRVLRAFEATLGGLPLHDASGLQLRAYLQGRVDAGAHPNTVRKELNMIRPVFAWLWEQGEYPADELLVIRSLKPPRGASGQATPNPYSRAELDVMREQIDLHFPWSTRGDRSRTAADLYLARWRREQSTYKRIQPLAKRLQLQAVVALALYGGIRLDEIYRLGLDDLDPLNGYVVVTGARKNARGVHEQRAVPWTVQEMRDHVEAWLELRFELFEHEHASDHGHTWLNLHQQHHLQPLRHKNMEALMRFGTGWRMHRLRHTAATEMIRSGYPLESVREIMGHTTIQQTLAYVKLVPVDLVRTAERHSARLAANIGGNA